LGVLFPELLNYVNIRRDIRSAALLCIPCFQGERGGYL
jgi:hypothetical protein